MLFAPHSKRRNGTRRKRGVATTELALALPLLLVFLLGTMDTGQFANTYQTISNASREGARVAAKSNTSNASDVQNAVIDYLDNAFAHKSAAELSESVSVVVSLPSASSGFFGTILNNLSGVQAGTPIQVTVSMPFDTVRYIPGLDTLDARTVQISTIMRRQ